MPPRRAADGFGMRTTRSRSRLPDESSSSSSFNNSQLMTGTSVNVSNAFAAARGATHQPPAQRNAQRSPFAPAYAPLPRDDLPIASSSRLSPVPSAPSRASRTPGTQDGVTYYLSEPRRDEHSYDTSQDNTRSTNNSMDNSGETAHYEALEAGVQKQLRRQEKERRRSNRRHDDGEAYRPNMDDSSDSENGDNSLDRGVAANGVKTRRGKARAEQPVVQPSHPRQSAAPAPMDARKRQPRASTAAAGDEGVEPETDAGSAHDEPQHATNGTPQAWAQNHYQVSPAPDRFYGHPMHAPEPSLKDQLRDEWRRAGPRLKAVPPASWAFLVLLFGLWWGLKHWRSPTSVGVPPVSEPAIPMESFVELTERLAQMEKAYADLSASAGRRDDGVVLDRLTADSVHERVDEIHTVVSNQNYRIDSVERNAQAGINSLRSDYTGLKGEVRDLNYRQGQTETRVDFVVREVDGIKMRLGVVEDKVQQALDEGRLFEAFEKFLPANMPFIVKTYKGKYEIDPRTWVGLKNIFVGKGEVETVVREVINSRAIPTSKQPWRIQDHEEQVLPWLAQLVYQGRWDGMVPRKEFMKLIEEAVGTLREELRELKDEPRRKVSMVTITDGKGNDLTNEVQALVDAALLKYSKDVIAKKDFALHSLGARAVQELTSPSLGIPITTKGWRWFTQQEQLEGRPPNTALIPDVSPGICWAFKGRTGTIGINLARPRVLVRHITLEHVAKELALDVGTAPMSVEVYGFTLPEDLQRAKTYLDERPQDDCSETQTAERLLLTRFTYDADSPFPVQTFPVAAHLVDARIPFGLLLVKVLSNHGAAHTCIYRIRVHGEDMDPPTPTTWEAAQM